MINYILNLEQVEKQVDTSKSFSSLTWLNWVVFGLFCSKSAKKEVSALYITIVNQVRAKVISQLNNDISIYFNRAITWTSFLPLGTVWRIIFALKLKYLVALASLKSTISPLPPAVGSSLKYYHKLPDVFK